MKVKKLSIKSNAFKEIKISQNILKYFHVKSPFESQIEVHSHFSDLYIVMKGKATVQVSKNFAGGEEQGEGEIRNCKMHTYDTFEINSGDILLIPFGTAHKLIVDSGNFEQIVLKIHK